MTTTASGRPAAMWARRSSSVTSLASAVARSAISLAAREADEAIACCRRVVGQTPPDPDHGGAGRSVRRRVETRSASSAPARHRVALGTVGGPSVAVVSISPHGCATFVEGGARICRQDRVPIVQDATSCDHEAPGVEVGRAARAVPRTCGFAFTTSGQPCSHRVTPHALHCRSGHPCPPVGTTDDRLIAAIVASDAPRAVVALRTGRRPNQGRRASELLGRALANDDAEHCGVQADAVLGDPGLGYGGARAPARLPHGP